MINNGKIIIKGVNMEADSNKYCWLRSKKDFLYKDVMSVYSIINNEHQIMIHFLLHVSTSMLIEKYQLFDNQSNNFHIPCFLF